MHGQNAEMHTPPALTKEIILYISTIVGVIEFS